jgi:hypothetical protein
MINHEEADELVTVAKDDHTIVAYVGRPKLSNLKTVAAHCSCGWESPPGDRRDGTKEWLQHLLAVNRNEKLVEVPLDADE